MKVIDLFSGIGGFSLGLERAGMQTVAFCEINPFCRRVLAKHWPEVPIYDDVRKLSIGRLAADGIDADVICGGFPCQDISVAGKGKGIEGERSGLWSELARLIGELRPCYAIVENVSNLLGRGLDRVLGDLASLGYDAEWHCIPAAAAGAPHNRDRIWIVAYPDSQRPAQHARRERHIGVGPFLGSKTLADAKASNEQRGSSPLQMGWGRFAREATQDGDARRAEWSPEPGVGRVAHGVSNRVDRLGGLGNAVVPQVVEIIGHAILEATRNNISKTAQFKQ